MSKSAKSSSYAYVNFEFTVKKLQIQPTADIEPNAEYRVVWLRGKQATGHTEWKQLTEVADGKTQQTIRQAKFWEHRSADASKHQFVVENLHVPVKGGDPAAAASGGDKGDQKNKILEIKLFMRRDNTGDGQQIGRTVRWKLELSRDDAGAAGKPAKKKTGTLDIGDKGNIKDMQVSVSFQMQEVSPEAAQQAEQQRRASRKSRGVDPSAVTTEGATSGIDSDGAGLTGSRALATAQANEKERERERKDQEARREELRAQEAEQRRRDEAAKLAQLEAQQPPDWDGHQPPDAGWEQQQQWDQQQIQSPYAHPSQQGMMMPSRGHPGQQSGRRGHQHPDAFSEDPSQMPGNSVDVDKMKYQVLKLYHKLSEQGDQLEEKRRDLRQMHRLYVELKRDFEAAQEELDRREMRIGELQDQLAGELGERHELLRQQNEAVQRKSRGYNAYHEAAVYGGRTSEVQTAQRKNCECIIA